MKTNPPKNCLILYPLEEIKESYSCLSHLKLIQVLNAWVEIQNLQELVPNPMNLKPRVREVWQSLTWMAGRQLVSMEPPKLWSAAHKGVRTSYREIKRLQHEINPIRTGLWGTKSKQGNGLGSLEAG